MHESYLEVTYRHGRPFAAYYYLPREPEDKAHRTRRVEPGFVVDYSIDDRPIGIEIPAPGRVSLEAFNELLRELGHKSVSRREFAPLEAA